jgi:hypothetical protein
MIMIAAALSMLLLSLALTPFTLKRCEADEEHK